MQIDLDIQIVSIQIQSFPLQSIKSQDKKDTVFILPSTKPKVFKYGSKMLTNNDAKIMEKDCGHYKEV